MFNFSDHYQALSKNENVLVIFPGPQTYVSASWYKNPSVASTWNYMTVHAKGRIKFMDEEGTLKVITGLTKKYENNSAASKLSDMEETYVRNNLKAITGFEIKVEVIETVFKLSQDKTIENRESVISHLEKSGDSDAREIAQEMRLLIDRDAKNKS